MNNVNNPQSAEDTKAETTGVQPDADKNSTDSAPEQVEKKEEKTEQPEKKDVEEKTVGEEFGTSKTEDPRETIPFDIYKAMKKDIQDLKKQLEDRSQENRPIDQDDITALSKKYDVDSNFLNELASVIDKKNAEKYGKTIESLEQSTRQQKLDEAFKRGLKVALDKLPEYKGIINRDVIKALSMDPKNSSKTISQLIKDIYGNIDLGKRTLETPTGNARETDTSVDVERARKDPAYFSEVRKDPERLKEYNAGLMKRLNL